MLSLNPSPRHLRPAGRHVLDLGKIHVEPQQPSVLLEVEAHEGLARPRNGVQRLREQLVHHVGRSETILLEAPSSPLLLGQMCLARCLPATHLLPMTLERLSVGCFPAPSASGEEAIEDAELQGAGSTGCASGNATAA